jgi:hypothetical protein
MHREELYLSTTQIRVKYRFFNASSSDVTTLVAFSMPDIAMSEPDVNISIATVDPQNLLAFATLVEGTQVKARVEQKALAGNIDRSNDLRRFGVPLAPHLPDTSKAFDRSPRPLWNELIKLGLAEVEGYNNEEHLAPRWTRLGTQWNDPA